MIRRQDHHYRPGLALSRWSAVALFLIVMLMFWVALGLQGFGRGSEDARPMLMRLWLIAAVLALLLTKVLDVRRYFFQPDRSDLEWPVVSLLLSSLLFAAVGHARELGIVAWVHLLWLGLTLARAQLRQRSAPPLRLGVVSAPMPDLQKELLKHGMEVVPISTQQPQALQAADALLIDTEQPSALQRRLQEHAQVMNMPVITQLQLTEVMSGKVAVDQLDGDWLRQSAYQTSYHPWKRFFDVAATVLAAPLLLPLIVVVAGVVYVNSGSPILFWQERVGKNGVPFQLVKFRTMTRDSERSGPAFARQGDQRITPVGAFLRKFRLDELPQFYNVLRGEMSIIGPRPEQWAFVAEFEESIPLYATRHWVRPGITGWAQVHQGYTDSVGQTIEKLQYDFYYVKHCSPTTDLTIVWKTILTILTGFGSR